MNIKFNLKCIWLAVGVISLILLAFHWFGYDSNNLENAILALNVLAFALSLPCSLFIIPVVVATNHFMAISPVSGEGIYLNTIFLFVIGAMQWFWIARFWSPTEPPLQILDLPNGN
jgi:hypothetical protein